MQRQFPNQFHNNSGGRLPNPDEFFRDKNYNNNTPKITQEEMEAMMMNKQNSYVPTIDPQQQCQKFEDINNAKIFQIQSLYNDINSLKAKIMEIEKRVQQLDQGNKQPMQQPMQQPVQQPIQQPMQQLMQQPMQQPMPTQFQPPIKPKRQVQRQVQMQPQMQLQMQPQMQSQMQPQMQSQGGFKPWGSK